MKNSNRLNFVNTVRSLASGALLCDSPTDLLGFFKDFQGHCSCKFKVLLLQSLKFVFNCKHNFPSCVAEVLDCTQMSALHRIMPNSLVEARSLLRGANMSCGHNVQYCNYVKGQ